MTDPRISTLVLLLAVGLATVTDLRRFRVSNALTFLLLVSGFVFHSVAGGLSGFGLAASGAAFGFFILLPPYLAGGMGAGDVKLFAGIGAWLGVVLAYHVLIAAALAGGIYALVLVIVSGRFRETLGEVKRILSRQVAATPSEPVQQVVHSADRHRRLVPFAAMLAIGLLATVAHF